ncbi:MAG: Pyrrolysine--tRNA ligase [Methanomassiliicoccales archaeon PtaU1.Bin124]|nr:MAG: Pyrrolysine--tRNA ligase [Methanomassiliicoccales archaeon PtaU1.Bin124]
MAITFSAAQNQRIRELDCESNLGECIFETESEREDVFRKVVNDLVDKNRSDLLSFARMPDTSGMHQLQCTLANRLAVSGFMQVHTPTMMSVASLEKMGIGDDHPLRRQIFSLDQNRCLRPMLAPNLYAVMKRMARAVPGRFGIFEIGKCFRKESKGAHHIEEFTMLNLVDVRPSDGPEARLKELSGLLSRDLGLPIEIAQEGSDVYGTTLDLEVNGVELASAAYGPHPLDKAFHVDFPWAGIGMGLERVLMVQAGSSNIHRHAASLVYQYGTRIDI